MRDAFPGRSPPSPRCPRCGRPVSWRGAPSRPFCSTTCQLIDLGAWLDETYRVPRPPLSRAPVDPELADG